MRICRRDFGARVLAGLAASATRLQSLAVRPKLLVLVVIEQFRPDYLDAAQPQLSPGGFRRLLERGAYFPDCRHLASSFPASTLATLASGAWPAQHGIIADTWYDRTAKKIVTATDEELLATTLAAQVASGSRTRVAVLSLEEMHSSIFAGTPDARQYWMDKDGLFATNSDVPDWLSAFNSQRPLDALHDYHWIAVGAKPDAPPLRVLTYDPKRPQEFLTLYRSSPSAMLAQFEMFSEMLKAERWGQANTFDLACLLIGSTELLGYETGARSPLMQQMILQIDRKLEALLAQLSKTPGERDFTLVVMGAHGAPPEPLPESRERMAVSGEAVAQLVDKSLQSAASGRVDKYLYPFLYLDTSGFRDPEPLRQAAARAAMQHPAVAAWYTAGGECSLHNDWACRFRNSFHPVRSGDVMLSYLPECIEDFGPDRGVSYGSLYNYDIRVPLCFYGPQFKPAIFETPVEAVDIAPTLARAIGVAAPSSSIGRVLGEAFA